MSDRLKSMDNFKPKKRFCDFRFGMHPGSGIAEVNYYTEETLNEEWGVNRKINGFPTNDDNSLQALISELSCFIYNHKCSKHITENEEKEFIQDYIGDINLDDVDVFLITSDIQLSWLKKVNVYIIYFEKIQLTDVIPCLVVDNQYTIKNDTGIIEKASILFFNPQNRSYFSISKSLRHELRHFYDLYNNPNASKYNFKQIGDIVFGTSLMGEFTLNLNNTNPDYTAQKVKNLNEKTFELYIGTFIYYLNKDESETFLENIFDEIYDYFKNDRFKFMFDSLYDIKKSKMFVNCSQTLRSYIVMKRMLQNCLDIKPDYLNDFWDDYALQIEEAYKTDFQNWPNFFRFLLKRCNRVLGHAQKYFMKFYNDYYGRE